MRLRGDTNVRLAAVLAIVLTGLLVAACGSGSGGPGSGASAASGDAATGKRLFTSAGCAGCHTFKAAGSTGTAGPDLDQVRPGIARVLQQLKQPTGAMPSFAGRLDADEMNAIAAFVGGAAVSSSGEGGAPSVTAPFKPDRRRLADCKDDAVDCLEQAFANLAYTDGPKKALDLLQTRATPGSPVAADCHRITHRIGAAALVRFKGDVATAFSSGAATCASGYYHGIIERDFLGKSKTEVDRLARQVCQGGGIAGNRFLAFQCLHGLGHGLMIYSGYDLPGALKTCDGLQQSFDQTSCTGGAFMENFSSSYGVRSKYLRDDDPIYPCDATAERHKAACYGLVTANLLARNGGDLRKTAAGCRRSEPAWVQMCFESYGRDVSGIAGRSAQKARQGCSYAGANEGDCLYGVVREIANSDAGTDRAARFCGGIRSTFRRRCYSGIGTLVASLERDRRGMEAACRRLGRAGDVPCLEGAGLRAPTS